MNSLSKMPILILEESVSFKKGEIIKEYKEVEDGININGKFVNNNNYIILKEKFTYSEERQIKELIKKQLKNLFYNLYAKQNQLI